MAINYELLNKGGISLSANFELLSEKPLDTRLVVPSLEGLQNYIDNAAAYEGMIVFVTAEKETYQVVKNADGALTYEIFGITEEEVRQWILNDTTAAVEFIGVTDKLPTITNEATARGNMYKASGTFALPAENNAEANAAALTVKIGDSIVYSGNGKWYHIPAGDVDTWRKIHVVDGDTTVTLKDTVDLTLIAGENITLEATENGQVTISSKDTDTHHEAHLVFGNQDDDTACENADTSTGALYMNLVENGEIRDTHKIAVADDTPMVITHSKDEKTLTFEILENSKDDNGYIKASNGQANKVWKTDENGNPDWREDKDTTYTGEDKIIVDGTVIKHEKLAEPATGEKEKDYKSTFMTGAIVDEYGHVTGYTTADVYIPDVTLDGKSIDKNDAGEIEVKGFKKAANLTLPQKNANGEISWVTIDKAIEGATENTVTTGDAGNINNSGKGSIVHKETEIGYEVSIKGADKATAGQVLKAKGNGDVEWAADNDTKYDFKISSKVDEVNNPAMGEYLHLVDKEGNIASTLHLCTFGGVDAGFTRTYQDTFETYDLNISAPDVELEKTDDWAEQESHPDFVNVVGYDEFEVINERITEDGNMLGTKRHKLAVQACQVPTKEYVDRLVSGATSYLGTVANEAQLKALNPEKGDFVRVSEPFNGYHASDMLICETPKAEGVDATWSLIHGEIDTDTDTWRANTKDADGYVTKGEGQADKVWKTDKDGNPAWRQELIETLPVKVFAHLFTDPNYELLNGSIETDENGNKMLAIRETVHEDSSYIDFSTMLYKALSSFNYAYGDEYINCENEGRGGGYPEDQILSVTLTDKAKASLGKADTAVQEITTIDTSADHTHGTETTCGGLKVTPKKDAQGKDVPGSVNIELDDSLTFVFNCGGAAQFAN